MVALAARSKLIKNGGLGVSPQSGYRAEALFAPEA
jgi:hypothetical protein